MKEKREHFIKEISSRFFLPSWLVYGVESAFQQDFLEYFSSQNSQLGLPFFDKQEWKLLPSILSKLQEDIFLHKNKQSFQLSPQEILKDVSVSQKYHQASFVRLLRRLSEIKLYLPKSKEFIGKNMFSGEQWQMRDNEWVLLLESNFDTNELLLGLPCAYSDWLRYHTNNTCLFPLLANPSFLSCWKAIWLDLSGIECLLFLRLEMNKQWQINKGQIASHQAHHRKNIFELFSGVSFKTSKKTPVQYYIHSLKKLSQKLFDHGFLEYSYHDDHFQGFQDELLAPCLYYTSSNDHWLQSRLNYQKESCKVFVERCLAGFSGDFFHLMGLGLSSEKITEIKQEALSFINTETGSRTKKLFIQTTQGQILPLVMLAIEWHFRSQEGHLLSFPQDFEQLDFGVKIKRPENLSYQERLELLIKDVEKHPSFVNFIVTHQLATLTTPNFFGSRQAENYDKLLRNTLSSDYNYLTFSAQKAPHTKHLQHKVSSVDDVVSDVQISDHLDDGYKDHDDLKRKNEEELDRMHSQSKESYIKIRDSYIHSLDPKAKEILLSFKERLRPEVFDIHLHNRLINYMSKGVDKKTSKSISVTLQ